MIPFQFYFEAETEFNEAAAFYESKVSHLKEAFIEEVERCITIIRQRPEAAAPLGKLLRKINLRRFPYSIVFHHGADGLLILAIAHQSRRPGYWRARMK